MLRIFSMIIFTFSLFGCGGSDSSGTSNNNSSSNTNTGTGSSGIDNSSSKSFRLVTIIGDYDNDGNEDGRYEFDYDEIGRMTYQKLHYTGDDVLDKVWVFAEGTGIDSTKIERLDETIITYENSTDGQVKTVTQRVDTTNSGFNTITTTNHWVTYNSDNLLSSIESEIVEYATTINTLMEYDGKNLTSSTQNGSGYNSSTVHVYDVSNRVIESKIGTTADAEQFSGSRYTYTSDGKMKSITEGEFNTNAATPVVNLNNYVEYFFDGDKVDSYIRKLPYHGDNSIGDRYTLMFHEDGYIEEVHIDKDDDGSIDGKETWVFEEQPCVLTWNFIPGHVWTYATASMENSLSYYYYSRMACM